MLQSAGLPSLKQRVARLPQPVEPAGGGTRVMRRVPGIAVSEVILDQPQVVAAIGQGEAAGVPQHVRMDGTEPGTFSGCADDVVHRLPCQWLPAFGDEQPGQGAQLVPRDRMLDAQPVLQPRDPEPGLRQVSIDAAQGDGLGHAQPMPVHRQDQKMVADPVSAFSSGGQQPVDLRRTEIVAAALMGIGRAVVITLDISPVGHALHPFLKALQTGYLAERMDSNSLH